MVRKDSHQLPTVQDLESKEKCPNAPELMKIEKKGLRTTFIGLSKIWMVFSDFSSSLSHGVFSSPLSSSGLVLRLVGLVDMSNLWNKRIIWVGIGQKRTDGEKNLGDGECWRPLILQDIQTDRTIRVDVWVVDSCGEINLRWLEWVVSWEMDVQEVDTTGIRGIIWSHDGCLPVILVLLVDWSG